MNTLGKCAPVTEEKKGEEMKRKRKEKKNRPRLCLAEERGKNGKSPNVAPPLLHEYRQYFTPMELESSQRPPGSWLVKWELVKLKWRAKEDRGH